VVASPGRRRLYVTGRLVNLAFFVLTAGYCLLESSTFTNEQFVKPGMSQWLTMFVAFHTDLYWLALSTTALTMALVLERPRATIAGWVYLGIAAAGGLWLTAHGWFAVSHAGGHALNLAMLALAPPILLAIFDLAVFGAPPFAAMRDVPRLLAVCASAALYCWLTFAIAAPFRLKIAGLAIQSSELWTGIALSGVAQLAAFLVLFLAMLAVIAVSVLFRLSPVAEYVALALLSGVTLTVLMARLVLAPIAIVGPAAWAFAAIACSALVLVWSAIAVVARSGRPDETAVDLWCAPVAAHWSRRSLAVLLALLPIAAFAAAARVSLFDWDFMFQKLVAIGVAIVAFGALFAIVKAKPSRARRMAPEGAGLVLAACAIAVVIASASWPATEHREAIFGSLDTYLAAAPALRLARDLTAKHDESSAQFFTFLRANTGLKADIRPIDVTFASSFARDERRLPHIFFFIVDSLRPDYLSVYNPSVTFTPNIGAFAQDSVAFTRTYSRYGGTGLSVPAIWTGGLIAHKEYITPFASMNALAKLLAAHEYRRYITGDEITDVLFPHTRDTIDLDAGLTEMRHTMCGTVAGLEARLAGRADDPQPIFAHTRSLDLHIGNVWSTIVPNGESYPGFMNAYASRLHRLDACFGEFMTFLHREGLYDDSIIILTADHGDSLGEGLRWGHGFTVFPEVLSVPLLVHVPKALLSEYHADPDRVSFTVDITPTLYSLLGDVPRVREPLFGSPLFVKSGDALTDRREQSYMVVSSYGAVYGLISDNGTRLYIADAINGREYDFVLGSSADGTRIGLTDARRGSARAAIIAQLEALGAEYHYVPGEGEP